MSLCCDPPACNIPAAGGSSNHKLINGTPDRLVFKMKSSNNNDYRITPVFGFVEPLNSADLNITRTTGPPKEDKLVVHYSPAPPDATDPQATFGLVLPAGMFTIPITAVQ